LKIRFLTIVAAVMVPGTLPASTVSYNPAPTTDPNWHTCGTFFYASLQGDYCRTTAFFQPDSLLAEAGTPASIAATFGPAFDAWNRNDNVSNNPPGTNKGWTLGFGGDPGGTFNVSVAQAQQFDQNRNPINNNVITGGLTIQITPNAALRTTLATAVTNLNAAAADGKKDYQVTWAQGLFDNFMFNPTRIVPPFFEMDVNAANAVGANADPSYCLSFTCLANNTFSDVPNVRYFPLGQTQAFFRANAYIAVESVANKSLIIYDGVDYGWDNFVMAPEPLTWALLTMGLLLIAYRARQQARCARRSISRSTCSKACWSTSAPPAAPRRPSPHGWYAVRSETSCSLEG